MEDRAISQDEIEMQQEYDLQKKLGLSDEEWEYGCLHHTERNGQMEDRAISLNAALEAFADYVASGYADSAEDFGEYSRILQQLPSVTPQRPKWIETGDVGYIEDTAIYEFQCSKCKSLAYFRKSFNEIVGGAFCSNCGADMRGDAE